MAFSNTVIFKENISSTLLLSMPIPLSFTEITMNLSPLAVEGSDVSEGFEFEWHCLQDYKLYFLISSWKSHFRNINFILNHARFYNFIHEGKTHLFKVFTKFINSTQLYIYVLLFWCPVNSLMYYPLHFPCRTIYNFKEMGNSCSSAGEAVLNKSIEIIKRLVRGLLISCEMVSNSISLIRY